MAILRPHLALTVSSVARSIPFYSLLFGTEPSKVRAGYAKFEVVEPGLNFTLNEGRRDGVLGALNHVGIQVTSTDDVAAAARRLRTAGIEVVEELGAACCHARQDKLWVRDPDGTPWEVFTVLEDIEDVTAPNAATATCCA